MTYEIFMTLYKEHKWCSVQFAEEAASELLKKIRKASQHKYNGLNESNCYLQLIEIAAVVTEPSVICEGTDDEFHNLAVTYAKEGFKSIACKIIERGLQRNPTSPDLLADYLPYGMACGEDEMCQKFFVRLKAINAVNWKWRGFDFSISYLLGLTTKQQCSEEQMESIRNNANELAVLFKKYCPNDEKAYLAQANIYNCFNEKELEINELKEGLENVSKAPKCALRLADILFEQGKYEETLEYIKRCIEDYNSYQQVISYGYPYLLSALCKMSLFLRQDQKKEKYEEKEEEIKEIYHLCDIAKAGNDMTDTMFANIETLSEIFEKRTEIKNPYKLAKRHDYYDD